ncbi:MAG: hypothetical protein COV55_03695 [Candidatus Komeilibacteria bacterium CG11_big_fil_rev_8_21_14_0_20_36_20]|uniref:O-antigen ligase-related domain-containing protein n=1 Tax=Candidatus Komeilibacteria bacterium CG11_big_fil_rev_8_21_14_0_20_36_20 TaxID=1974477 RepID=A0A2H0NCH6_9BACT|nr:MAG: hypothetical protein COV55_03695 [Candidatus Komeilibacteria bacterium CG11_big_fil_rev_8_21_14_0_20_36_20]PIR81933.1 MAG: hypothetical protein COU21_01140 [Candidatus Komeilibacteria bacterium CG10_big_fil_rev_8_21_14_0_10_36_65]PJC55465.1 MAG: hypothetical protein CO027_01820 [Candidatus Komeilibacteria bacterium CG_4_9_14_0_2_um_filter_36_13]
MTWILLILLLATFVYFSYRRPLLGLVGIIVLLPSYLWRISLFGLPTTFLELMIISLFIIWLIKDKKYSKIKFSFKKNLANKLEPVIRILLFLWLAVSLIALAVNPTQAALGLWRAYWLEPMMFFLVFIYSVNSKQDLRIIFKAAGVLVVGLFLITVYQYFTGWNLPSEYNWPNIRRSTAIFSYPNALSLLTAAFTAFFIGLWAAAKNKIKDFWCLIVFIFGLWMIFLAVSEGAMVAIGASLFFWLILAKKIRKFGIPIIAAALLLIIFLLPVTQYFNNFKQQLFQPELNLQATSLEIRSSQWQETWSMLQDNLIFGSGIYGYQDKMLNYHHYEWLEIYLYSHNIFLNFWAEIGLFGLIIFLAIMLYIVVVLRKLFIGKSELAWPLTLMWLTWFVQGLVDVPYFKNDLSILFFLFLGITLFAQEQLNIKESGLHKT